MVACVAAAAENREMRWVAALVSVALLVWAGFRLKGCIDVDRCLDAGGRYDYTSESCQGTRDRQ
jgi:hypothetical protein